MAKIKLKVGDKVQIYRRVRKEECWINCWIYSMDAYIGGEFMVSYIHPEDGVYLSNNLYGWPPSSLKRVKS